MSCEIKEITIDGEAYVRKSDVKTDPVDESTEPLRIIMNMDRGLSIVGNVNLSGCGPDDMIKIKNGRCIIRWGTSKHLAELAEDGPKENTKLGRKYTHNIPRRSIGLYLDCNKEKWQ